MAKEFDLGNVEFVFDEATDIITFKVPNGQALMDYLGIYAWIN